MEVKTQFYDINKFPAIDGLILFPISMSRISNSQNGAYYFKIIDDFKIKLSKPVLGACFIYTDNLYSKYQQESNTSIHKYIDLMISHKNQFLKTLLRNSTYIERAFSFHTWTQLTIETKGYLQNLEKIKKLYNEDKKFKQCVKKDILNSGRKLNKNNVNFILEETLMAYLLLKEVVYLQNEFVNGRDKWRLLCYPGKPNLSFCYFFQKDIFKIKSNNQYQNCFYNLEKKKLYDMIKINVDDFL